MTRCHFLGFEIDAVSEDAALLQLLTWSEDQERTTRIVTTLNAAILMMARDNERLAMAIRRADLVVADGQPIVWASRWASAISLPERVTGVDLMARLLERGAERGMKVFLLGTTQERLHSLIEVIRSKYPGIEVVGSRNGYFSFTDGELVAQEVRDSRADLLLIGMPAPIKEIWAEEYRDVLRVPVVLGVGGAFDVLAGFVPRAPKQLQRAGLEWAWRLMLEPRKLWKRYLVTNTRFLVTLGRTLLSSGKRW